MLNNEFLLALFHSGSFYQTVGLYGLLAVALLVVIGFVLARRLKRGRSLARLHADQAGVSTVVDFTMTLPLLIFALMLIVQFMVMCNDALIVHYSAYSAARSARVWMNQVPSVSEAEQREHIERAARLALIPAAPADPSVNSNPVDFPGSMLDSIANSAGFGARSGPLRRKAAYAFDPDNAQIEFRRETRVPPVFSDEALQLNLQGRYARPVTARVTFRVHLGVTIVRLFGTDRGDGQHFTVVDAEMTLL